MNSNLLKEGSCREARARAMNDASELCGALRIVALVLGRGARDPEAPNHWLKLSVREHVARAMVHLDKFIVDAQTGEDDLANALVRLLLAVERRERALAPEARRKG